MRGRGVACGRHVGQWAVRCSYKLWHEFVCVSPPAFCCRDRTVLHRITPSSLCVLSTSRRWASWVVFTPCGGCVGESLVVFCVFLISSPCFSAPGVDKVRVRPLRRRHSDDEPADCPENQWVWFPWPGGGRCIRMPFSCVGSGVGIVTPPGTRTISGAGAAKTTSWASGSRRTGSRSFGPARSLRVPSRIWRWS